jgi:tRNA (guanine37-N1)-methyltransferase
MIYDILTLFPDMFTSFLTTSIIGRAARQGTIQVRCYNIRDFAAGRHRVTDDTPYGGGSGMLMKPEPLVKGIQAVRKWGPEAHVILLSPQGKPFHQDMAWEFARRPRIILVCGRYEGVDERVRKLAVDEEISIGDFVLTGGEVAAMALVDATARLLPGVLGDEQSPREETFCPGLLEYPQYTRPREFMDQRVPDILLSGDHKKIADWRRNQSLERTLKRRPELIEKTELTDEDRRHLEQLRKP